MKSRITVAITALFVLATTQAATLATAQAQERIAIGTGGTGGVFYAVGAGMAELLGSRLDGVTANAEVTGASIENIRRVSMGEMMLGFSSASTLYAGLNAEDPFDDPQNVAAVAYLYPAVLQIAASRKSGASSVSDLEELRVSIGPPGSNSSVLAERVLGANDAWNMGKIQFLSYNEATAAIKNGNLDASMILAGVPAAAFIELFTTTESTLLPVDSTKVEGLLAEYPYYELVEIPADVYAGSDTAITALGDPAILFTAADADPELIYQITRTLFDNLEELGAVHPAAQKITREKASDTPIALHEGAARYFSE